MGVLITVAINCVSSAKPTYAVKFSHHNHSMSSLAELAL